MTEPSTSSSDQPLLVAENIHRLYRLPRSSLLGPRSERHAVCGVDVSLHAGCSLGIVGESGSGKSTLIRVLIGLDRPTIGTVHFEGRAVEKGRPRSLRWFRRKAQIVLQDPLSSLDPRMTINSIVAEPLICLDVPGDRRQRVAEVLDAVGLDAGIGKRYPHEFSGGQQQRIAIARAIAPRPALLVGDEPVSALDVSVRVQILELLKQLAKDNDLALILVSHDLGVVRYLCDEVMVLHNGEVAEQGRTADVFRSPSDPYTQALLNAVPRLPAV